MISTWRQELTKRASEPFARGNKEKACAKLMHACPDVAEESKSL